MKYLLALIVFLGCNSYANMQNFQLFKKEYPKSPTLHKCTTCHDQTPQLNAYGLDLGNANMDFKSIEEVDSDGDGVNNLAEILAGTNPGKK